MFTSRSAHLCYKACPRKRYYNYEYNNTGIVSSTLELDTTLGTCFHKGMEVLLNSAKDDIWNNEEIYCESNQVIIDNAVKVTIDKFEEELATKRVNHPDLEYYLSENVALLELMIRVWAIARFPTFNEQYEVLEVENEELLSFPTMDGRHNLTCNKCKMMQNADYILDGKCFNCSSYDIEGLLWQGKADGLLRNRLNNGLYILSFKTANGYPAVTERNILHDMQGISEWYVIDKRINKAYKDYSYYRYNKNEHPDFDAVIFFEENLNIYSINLLSYFAECYNSGLTEPKIKAVQYEYCIKGSYKEEPWNSGIRKRQNSLLRPYKKDSTHSISVKSGTFGTIDAEYKWKASQGRQPSGWDKINIWEDIGVKTWVELLASGEIQPEEGNPFEDMIKVPTPVVRGEDEIKSWFIQTSFTELEIANRIKELEEIRLAIIDKFNDKDFDYLNYVSYRNRLDEYFPQNTSMCHDFYGKDCPYVDICFFPNVSPKEGLENGLYQVRKSHHEAEKLYQIEKGFIKE